MAVVDEKQIAKNKKLSTLSHKTKSAIGAKFPTHLTASGGKAAIVLAVDFLIQKEIVIVMV